MDHPRAAATVPTVFVCEPRQNQDWFSPFSHCHLLIKSAFSRKVEDHTTLKSLSLPPLLLFSPSSLFSFPILPYFFVLSAWTEGSVHSEPLGVQYKNEVDPNLDLYPVAASSWASPPSVGNSKWRWHSTARAVWPPGKNRWACYMQAGTGLGSEVMEAEAETHFTGILGAQI